MTPAFESRRELQQCVVVHWDIFLKCGLRNLSIPRVGLNSLKTFERLAYIDFKYKCK